jgi:hypothetical protein
MKSHFHLPLISSLILGALLVGALPGHAQTTNVTVDSTKSWSGYQNVFDTNNAYLSGSGVPTADLRAVFTPNVISATNLFLLANTNTYKTDGTFNLPDGTPNRFLEENFYVDMATAFAGLTVTFSGTVLSNTLPGYPGLYGMATIKEFGPGYAYIGQTDVDLPPGPFTVSRAIGAGNICQYGFYTKGPNAAPNSADAAKFVRISTKTNAPAPPATVTVDPTQTWIGFLNYLTTNDAYVGGFSIGPSDLPAGFIPDQASATRVILGINTSTYDAMAPASVGGQPVNTFNNPDGTPNKHLELDFYVDVGGLYSGTALTFNGTVESNGLPAGWVAYCVIKEFTSGYGYVGATPVALPSSGPFTVTRLIAAGDNSQYGFYVYGPNMAPGSPASTKKVSILVATATLPVTLTASRVGGNIQIKFPTQTGVSYTVQYKSHLTDAGWLTLTTIPGDGNVATATDTIGGAGTARYYRVCSL